MNLEDYYKMEMSNEVAEKLQAILLATTTDAFYEDPVAFRAICNTLIEGDPGFDGFDKLTVPEILWSIYEVELNHPGMDFARSIKLMIEKELEEEVEDLDELDEAIQVPYYQRAIRELKDDLDNQLVSVGFENHGLPSVESVF